MEKAVLVLRWEGDKRLAAQRVTQVAQGGGRRMDYLAVAHSFSLLHRRSQAVVLEKCQKIGLSYPGYGLLLTLFEHEGSSQEELATRLFMDKTVVTREIQALEARGFVTRCRDVDDRRRKRLYLTPLARKHQAFLEGVLHY